MNYRALIQNRKSVRAFTDKYVSFEAMDQIKLYHAKSVRRLLHCRETALRIFHAGGQRSGGLGQGRNITLRVLHAGAERLGRQNDARKIALRILHAGDQRRRSLAQHREIALGIGELLLQPAKHRDIVLIVVPSCANEISFL